MSSYAASGGYYISAAANQIFASPTTIDGIHRRVFRRTRPFSTRWRSSASRSTASAPRRSPATCAWTGRWRPATKQILQTSVDHAYAEFLRRVGDGRKKSVEDVDKIAQGRVWAGVDAQRIGLVDHLGGLKDATDAAAKLAELGSDYEVRLHRA